MIKATSGESGEPNLLSRSAENAGGNWQSPQPSNKFSLAFGRSER
jgi:hypothetical protein